LELGDLEGQSGNINRAMRHYIISAKRGYDESLDQVKQGFLFGFVTKSDYEMTLQAHKASQDETTSEQRDRAKAIQAFEDLCEN